MTARRSSSTVVLQIRRPGAMSLSRLTLLVIFGLGAMLPARADSTIAYCQLSRHDHTIPVESGPCQFSQHQGNVNVLMGKRWAFRFPADQQGQSYQRSNSEQGLRFNREGDYTLSVFWRRSLQCTGNREPVSIAYTPAGADLAIGDQHVDLTRARSGSGARYTAQGVQLWEHQGSTRIDWFGTTLSCQ